MRSGPPRSSIQSASSRSSSAALPNDRPTRSSSARTSAVVFERASCKASSCSARVNQANVPANSTATTAYTPRSMARKRLYKTKLLEGMSVRCRTIFPPLQPPAQAKNRKSPAKHRNRRYDPGSRRTTAALQTWEPRWKETVDARSQTHATGPARRRGEIQELGQVGRERRDRHAELHVGRGHRRGRAVGSKRESDLAGAQLRQCRPARREEQVPGNGTDQC